MLSVCEFAKDGSTRRTFLRAGVLGLTGLNMADVARLRSAAPARRDTAVIFLFLGGGMSHIDTYDMKPTAPAEVRGELQPIRTNVVGTHVCELLPRQAQRMDKVAVVRTVAHTRGTHGNAAHFLLTGHDLPAIVPDGETRHVHPNVGCVVAARRGPNRPPLPPFVLVPYTSYHLYHPGPAYLPAAAGPFVSGRTTDRTTWPDSPDFLVREFEPAPGLDFGRLHERRRLQESLDRLARNREARPAMEAMDRCYADALAMLESSACRDAFHIQKEPRRERYGDNRMGQSFLLARRLVEAGVTFVTVNAAAAHHWDTHYNHFATLRNSQLPAFDQAFSALIDDIYQRGLDEKVLVVALGEFGREPRMNNGQGLGAPGREHWPQAMSVLFVGGGLKMGQVIGSTDRHAAFPTTAAFSPQDVFATIYRFLGIDHHHEFRDQSGRPVPILHGGTPIRELL